MGTGLTKNKRESSANPEPQPVGKLFDDDSSSDEGEGEEKKSDDKSIFKVTSLQKQLIQDTWNHIDDKIMFGKLVLKRIFVLYPDTKELFLLDEVPDDELFEKTRFRYQADHLSTFVHTVVGLLTTNESLVKRVAKVFGQEHFKPKLETNVDFKYWQAFDDAIVNEIESEQHSMGPEYSETTMSKNIKTAWSTFMTEVVSYAKSSYAEAKRSMNTQNNALKFALRMPADQRL